MKLENIACAVLIAVSWQRALRRKSAACPLSRWIAPGRRCRHNGSSEMLRASGLMRGTMSGFCTVREHSNPKTQRRPRLR